MNEKYFAQLLLPLPHAEDIMITAVASFCSGEAPSPPCTAPGTFRCLDFRWKGFLHCETPTCLSSEWSHSTSSCVLEKASSCMCAHPCCVQGCLAGLACSLSPAPDARKLRPGVLVPVHTHWWPGCSCPSGGAD